MQLCLWTSVKLLSVSFCFSLSDQALLVSDQFVVTFDGHLYELRGSCPLLLAQDVSAEPSFTLLLRSDPHNFLLIGLDNSTVSIQHNGQVRVNAGGSVNTRNTCWKSYLLCILRTK